MTNAFGVELHSELVRWAAAEGVSETVITILAENGTTTARLMAIYDWSTPGQAEVYIRAANRIAAGGAAIAHEVDRAGNLILSYLPVSPLCRTAVKSASWVAGVEGLHFSCSFKSLCSSGAFLAPFNCCLPRHQCPT